MRRGIAVAAASAALLWAAGAMGVPKPYPDFAAYTVPVYDGPARQPAFRGAQRPYADYRTRIRRSVQEGVRFGGHYAVMVAGCGTGCRFGFITDVRTGLVYDLPRGGEDYPEIDYRMRPNSRLLRAQWVRMSRDYDRIGCVSEDFAWTGKTFRSLGTRVTKDECPAAPDIAPASD